MQGWARKGRPNAYKCGGNLYCAGAPACSYDARADRTEAAVLTEVSSLVEVLTRIDPAMRGAVARAWRALQEPKGAAGVTAQLRQLDHAAEQARQRLTRAAVLYADGDIDKEGYELLRDKARADLEAAEGELARVQSSAEPARVLPPLDVALRDLGGWADALAHSSVPAQRDVLEMLIDRVIPTRVGRGEYQTEIVWTPEAQALRELVAIATQAAA